MKSKPIKPNLEILVGLSASGKSTYAQVPKYKNAIIISSDSIRGEICPDGVTDQSMNVKVFELFHKRIDDNLKLGNNVIADATNLTIKDRKLIIDIGKKYNAFIIANIFVKPVSECITDNINREYPVPDYVILKQRGRFQIPFYEEGFDDIRIINNCKDMCQDILFFNMTGFNQKNSHHQYTLDVHCELVAKKLMNKLYIPNKALKFAIEEGAMLHDYGKLLTQTFDEETGEAHYYQHDNVGAYEVLCNNINDMRMIGSDNFLLMIFLINYHMLPFNWVEDKTKEKCKNIFGEKKYNLLIEFNQADREES